MWIVPSPCEVTPLWATISESSYFVLQHNGSTADFGRARTSSGSGSSVWSNMLGTIQAMFDNRQEPFRILLKTSPVRLRPGDTALTIAVEGVRSEGELKWQWLAQNVVPEMERAGDFKAAVQLAASRIEGLVSASIEGTDEAASDFRFRATARSFRQTFSLPASERLVNYYSCRLSEGGLGWLYLSENYLAFYSYIMGVETKHLIELKNVTQVTKERSKTTLLPDSVSVATVDGRHIKFSNLFHREETYELLQSLVNRAGHRLLRTALSPNNSLPETINSDRAKSATHTPKPSEWTGRATTVKEDMEKDQRDRMLQTFFRIPAGEQLVEQSWAILWAENRPGESFRGYLYLTPRFLLFSSESPPVDTSKMHFSLPICAIRLMEKVYRSDAAEETPTELYAVSISTCHNHRIFMNVSNNLRQLDRFSFRMKEILLQNTDLAQNLLPEFQRRLPSERLLLKEGEEEEEEEEEDIGSRVVRGLGHTYGYDLGPKDEAFYLQERERELTLLQYWSRYFSEHGRNVTTIRTSFFDRLVRVGLPNHLRGELWEFCCGAMYSRLFSPQLYEDIWALYFEPASAAKIGPHLTYVMEEIEKDLNRYVTKF